MLWFGNTLNFRTALDKAGVQGVVVEEDNVEALNAHTSKHYHILTSLDVGIYKKKVQNIIKEVFHNLVMKVIVECDPVEDSSVAEFIEELRKVPNLHFKKRE